jgi:hypothetical protein
MKQAKYTASTENTLPSVKAKKSSRFKYLPHFSELMSPNYVDIMTLGRSKRH